MKEYYNNNYNDLIYLFKTLGYKDDIYLYALKLDDSITYYLDYELETHDMCISIDDCNDDDAFGPMEITEQETPFLNNMICKLKLDKELNIKNIKEKVKKV